MSQLIRLSPFCSMPEILECISSIRERRYECDFSCGQCKRLLACLRPEASLKGITDAPLGALSDEDYCRWCARPISAEAIAKAPLDGYIKIMCALVPDRTCGDHDGAIQVREETA